MKIYRIIDNSKAILTTTDRYKMLEAVFALYKKYEYKQSWFWMEEDVLQ